MGTTAEDQQLKRLIPKTLEVNCNLPG